MLDKLGEFFELLGSIFQLIFYLLIAAVCFGVAGVFMWVLVTVLHSL